jgi:hypothetical protein
LKRSTRLLVTTRSGFGLIAIEGDYAIVGA